MFANIIAGVGAFVFLISGIVLFYTLSAPVPFVAPITHTAPVVVAATTSVTNTVPVAEPEQNKPVATPPAAPIAPLAKPAPPPRPSPSQSDFEAAAAQLRLALVNILCISRSSGIPSISGSGVIIDPRGIIVTNTHIAQYYLLVADSSLDVSCVVRTGSPAKAAYEARPMFVSLSWLAENADLFGTNHPTGTGEYDFAFLAITGSATGSPLPATFPAVPFATGEAYKGEPAVVGSYAAQFLTSSEIQSTLYPIVVYGAVSDIFTFEKSTIDVITVEGSAAAQEGSSGGGIANGTGTLEGVITTSTIEGTTAGRTLAGITASYIRRHYESEAGESLATLFALSPIEAAALFAPKIPALRAIITAQISQ